MSLTMPKLAMIGVALGGRRRVARPRLSRRTAGRQTRSAYSASMSSRTRSAAKLRHHDEPVGERDDLRGHEHAEALGLVGRQPARRSRSRAAARRTSLEARREPARDRARLVGAQRVEIGEPHLVREHDARTPPELRERARVELAVPEAVHDAVVATARSFLVDQEPHREHFDAIRRARRTELGATCRQPSANACTSQCSRNAASMR